MRERTRHNHSMATSLIQLSALSLDDVRRSIREIAASRSRPDAIAEYVASVDWSGARGDEPVAQLLGALEHLTEEWAERDITEPQFWFELNLLRILSARQSR
jgi:hypothetical protein